jgi:hypothetical protein
LALLNWVSDGNLDLDDLTLHGRSDIAGNTWIDLGLTAGPGRSLRRVSDQNGSEVN